ncbi:MAG: MFS transporter [Peptacetobacter hiranonis]|nr:MFS transporter [Peptacetobacter hiranonis]
MGNTQTQEKKLYSSAFILYLNYFIHGIGCSILGQQVIKESLAMQWNSSVDSVTMIAAALGLGRLITLPFSGPISDKLGRRICSLIGVASYAIFFIGLAFSPNVQVAYIVAILGGVANSFLDTGVIPACVEILAPKSGLATMLTKLFISASQLLLPITLGLFATNNISYSTFMIGCAVALVVIGLLVTRIKLPETKVEKGEKAPGLIENIKHTKFTKESLALIAIGFTCTATFQLWLNCAQTFGTEVAGMRDAGQMQVWYSTGTIVAIVLTSVLVNKIKEVRFLFLYPLISLVMLVAVLMIKTPAICMIGSFVIGYSAAGGVLQLATATVNDLFPKIKGTITSIIMIASSLSNYTILTAAGKIGATSGPEAVMMMNIVITAIGVLLALLVNMRFSKLEEAAREN